MPVITAVVQRIRHAFKPVGKMTERELWEERESLESFKRTRPRTKAEQDRHVDICGELRARGFNKRGAQKR